MSGLKVNLHKSELLATSIHHDRIKELAGENNCQAGEFSMKYLGLSLSDRGLKKEHYKFMIQNTKSISRVASKQTIHWGKRNIGKYYFIIHASTLHDIILITKMSNQ
jgi:hypothetical protein